MRDYNATNLNSQGFWNVIKDLAFLFEAENLTYYIRVGLSSHLQAGFWKSAHINSRVGT